MAEQELKISKWNSMEAILFRINILWQDTHTHSRSGKFEKWNADLERIWCELSSDALDNDVEEFNKINEILYKIGFKQVTTKFGDHIHLNKEKLYAVLMKKEIFLRKLQNKQGKGVVYEDSIDDYMD